MLKKLLFILIAIGLSPCAQAQRMRVPPRKVLAYYAEKGDLRTLSYLVQQGHSLELADEYGNTLLCEEVWRQNRLAVSTLMQAGANRNPQCLQHIPNAYKSTMGFATTPEQPMYAPTPTAKPHTAVYAGGADYSDGMGFWSWAGLGVGAAALVGGGIALAGGGGGGSGEKATLIGKKGTDNNNGTINLTNTAYRDVIGLLGSGDWIYGSISSLSDVASTIQLTNTSQGNVYGIKYDYCSSDNGGASISNGYSANNHIKIINVGNGSVYGIHGGHGEAESAGGGGGLYGVYGNYTKGNTVGENLIEISNTGNGSVYGIYHYISQNSWSNSRYTHGAENSSHMDEGESTCLNNIRIENNGDSNIFGISGLSLTGASSTTSGSAVNTITIDNVGNSTIYGLYGTTSVTGSSTSSISKNTEASNIISIQDQGNNNIFGIYSQQKIVGARNHVNYSSTANTVNANNTISIIKSGNGNVYGMYGNADITAATSYSTEYNDTYNTSTTANSNSSLTIKRIGDGSTYGIYGTPGATIKGASASHGNKIATNTISINTIGSGNTYGIYGENDITGASASLDGTASNSIKISDILVGPENIEDLVEKGKNGEVNFITAKTYGIYGQGDVISSVNNATNTIDITSIGRYAVGIYGGQSVENASGDRISINYFGSDYDFKDKNNLETHIMVNQDSSYAVGLYVPKDATATNDGDIIIKREAWTDDNGTPDDTTDDTTYTPTSTNGKAYGIYVEGNNTSNKTVKNAGTITISGINDAYGIYVANGTNVTIQNTGSITLNGEACTGDCSGSTDNGKYIVLNGGTLLNASLMSANSLNTASLGGTLMAAKGAQFNIDDQMSGKLAISSDLTTQGFETTYVEKDMINAGDTSGLQLKSDSALFDATLADNGHDVVMRMKSFDEVTDNASVAKFLAKNYANANNESLFNTLKTKSTKASLAATLNKMMGQEMLSRFNFEDMAMMRELNFDMNNALFNTKENHLKKAGFVSSSVVFRDDAGSHSRYSLTSKSNGTSSVGLGIAFTDIRSDDNHDNKRTDSMYQMIVPIGYKAGGFKLITSPRLGYARGSYNRKGLEQRSYEGQIEKRIFGLMNEARYPVIIADWKLEPTAEFNMIGYEQKGHEDIKEYSLMIPKQRTYSVESGLGLYATREADLGKDSMLKLTAGVVVYHEFAAPYRMNVKMNGMDGFFTLQDEKRSNNRAIARAAVNYDTTTYGMTASVISYIDKETRTKANLDFLWKF